MKSLEAHINNADKVDSESPVQKEFTSKYEAFLGMLNKILSSDNIEQKSRLIFENVKAMTQAQCFQVAIKRGEIFQQIDINAPVQRFVSPKKYLIQKKLLTQADLDDTARKGMASLQTLCEELIIRVISIDGQGRDEMIEMVRAMNLMIQEHEHQDSMAKDLLLGARR